MTHKICLCPESIAWIKKHLIKSAKAEFTRRLKGLGKSVRKKTRTPKQKRADKRNGRRLAKMNRKRR